MKDVSSWGRLERSAHRTVPLLESDSLAAAIAGSPLPGLAYGMGRSYGDACLNPGGTLWETGRLDRFASFDAATGLLDCEAGVLLGDIQRTFAPRGWMLAVSPGTQFVTVGGAIANDVHGKNHHARGTFGEHVDALTLVRTDRRVIECGPQRESGWFAATVGGLGLTGVIARATLRLARVPGPWFEVQTLPFRTLADFFRYSDESEAAWEHTVAWIDCLSAEGRGIFFRGRPVPSDAPPPREHRRRLPVDLPLVNRFSLRAFNMLYHAKQSRAPQQSVQHYSRFLYPLDGIAHWNRIYGRRGFYQYQSVVPQGSRVEATREMLTRISRSGEGSFLAVLKTFGRREAPGMLSFPMHGVTLAVDFANAGERTAKLLASLDDVVRDAKGRLYPAKDARMPAALFEAGYPGLQEFKAYRDPGISSAMSRRLMGS
ncbi:FAD-binding oxidoreductase [Ramlibacter sp. PS4R-6]|uniref:FAD-binding oxidoreductase n=1 Tax=Ramlibacter sp. PS4R-6 TaxID=3133438 RepID=UPI0030AF4119